MEYSKITTESIIKDLMRLENKFGRRVVLLLCAIIIHEFCWWNWPHCVKGLLTDDNLNKIKKGANP